MSKNPFKVLGVIPARFASTRFPGKPLQKILEKTLIQHTYENALRSTSLHELVVATDDERIYRHVLDFGGKVVMTSVDCATGTDRIAEVINNDFLDYGVIVNIQGDEPCLDPRVIDKLVSSLIIADAPITTPIVELTHIEDILSPSVVKCVFDINGKALYFSRAPIPYPKALAHYTRFLGDQAQLATVLSAHQYYRHLGVYCFKREFLLQYAAMKKTPLQTSEDLEQLKILEHGHAIQVVIVEDQGMGVDRPEDIQKIEEIILCNQNIYSSPVV